MNNVLPMVRKIKVGDLVCLHLHHIIEGWKNSIGCYLVSRIVGTKLYGYAWGEDEESCITDDYRAVENNNGLVSCVLLMKKSK